MDMWDLLNQKPIEFLKQFYVYLQSTQDDDWQMGICRTIDDENQKERNCLFGHVCRFVQNNICSDIKDSEIFEAFEYTISSPYLGYSVNDGTNPDYPQHTPKERCLALVLDIIHGKELLINDSFTDFFNQNNPNRTKPIDMSQYDPDWKP